MTKNFFPSSKPLSSPASLASPHLSQLAKVTSGIDHYRNVTDINQCRELPLFSFLPTRETPPLPHSWTFHGRLTSSIITPIPTRGVAGEKQMCTILFSFPQHANRRMDPNPAMVGRTRNPRHRRHALPPLEREPPWPPHEP
ncbi:hypothetical protein V8G54_009565 [Vigna mungo]|uniref:Uncharacterized protein n=1 Tax=Vigna mungo TaxID=3915 RepID=A0AAQ3NYA2_VIGMU